MNNCLLGDSPKLGLYVQHSLTWLWFEKAQIIDAFEKLKNFKEKKIIKGRVYQFGEASINYQNYRRVKMTLQRILIMYCEKYHCRGILFLVSDQQKHVLKPSKMSSTIKVQKF